MSKGADPAIVLTGAAGRVGGLIRPLLAEGGLRVRLTDRTPIDDLLESESFTQLDVNDTSELASLCEGAELIVHLGGISAEAPREDIVAANINGSSSVLEAARSAGVGRVLLGSSSHVIGLRTVAELRAGELGIAPDTWYAVSKATVEALGALYAGRFDMLVVSARIGTLLEHPRDARQLSTWLSPADFVRLVEAVRTTDATGSHTLWATSHNTRALLPLAAGRRIGFEPCDDAEDFVGELGDPDPLPDDTVLGGRFAEHPLGQWLRVEQLAPGIEGK